MKITKIKLNDFRNYETLELSFDSSRNIFIGENAQGKTNLLEAVYLCAFARSFRTNNAAEMVRFGCERANVTAWIESEEINKELSVTINRSGKKMIKKDKKVLRRTTDLLSNLVVVIFSPEDLRIIKDSPDKRRYFIDREISQLRPRYHECLRNYNEALRQKNAILKEKKDNIDEYMLDVYDEQLAKYGEEIISYRKKFIEDLSGKANEIQQGISGGKEELVIRYKMSSDSTDLADNIRESRDRDMYFGYSSVGPHRDDLDFYIKGKDAKKYGSQGQQRTVALALKLAEIWIAREATGESPVLLLDDVLSELDEGRQNYLLQEIEDVQILITTTELKNKFLEKFSNTSIFNVSEGFIEKKG
ncbi:MAG: DNA replication/repair protein RecF [Mogibacterium sp.]|nr:DNA replication/repair protein RecF [Mogibacterium sp.]